ncbi:MAG: peroxidase-related enzyme [Bacteroidota bacterium]
MPWIKTISFDKATGKLKQLYNRVKGPGNNIDNILKVHSLRPHTLQGHMGIYKNVLHHKDNSLPKWYLETIGVYVSHLNQCNYCVLHHAEGLRKLFGDDEHWDAVMQALKNEKPEIVFDGKYLAGIYYAKTLTLAPGNINQKHAKLLSHAGFDDGEILELNQVISYFAYANRTVLGLGVTTDGDILGLSPNDNDDEENWAHT